MLASVQHLFVCNCGYTLEWIVELSRPPSRTLGPKLFKIGTIASAALILLSPLIRLVLYVAEWIG